MIGQLSERVSVYKKVRISNERGGWTATEDLLGVFWASVQPLDLRDQLQFKKLDMIADSVIYFRLNEELDTDCFAVWEGKKFKFEAVETPIKHGNYMKVICSGVKHGAK